MPFPPTAKLLTWETPSPENTPERYSRMRAVVAGRHWKCVMNTRAPDGLVRRAVVSPPGETEMN
ncbi:MAG: hypothetical protein NUV93_08780 [Firmicutes bacterium]|nr:hypothetical protein [Bacillota bacterium]